MVKKSKQVSRVVTKAKKLKAEGRSWRVVAETLNKAGHCNTQGNPWTSQAIRAKVMSKSWASRKKKVTKKKVKRVTAHETAVMTGSNKLDIERLDKVLCNWIEEVQVHRRNLTYNYMDADETKRLIEIAKSNATSRAQDYSLGAFLISAVLILTAHGFHLWIKHAH